MPVPALRLRDANAAPVRDAGACVLYWMTAQRRLTWNFALDRALEWCARLDRPLVILEALRCGHPWASDRLHAFVLAGMADNAAAAAKAGVAFHSYVEDLPGHGSGLLAALAGHACVVIADDWPGFFLPAMVAAAAARLPVRVEAVDGCGLLPLAAADRAFPTAHAFRRHLQKTLPVHLGQAPSARPFARYRRPPWTLPRALTRRWPMASAAQFAGTPAALAALPIDHAVTPVAMAGGALAAQARLRAFLAHGLTRYAEARNDLDDEPVSGLSPWLHFGHISAHQVAQAVLDRAGWSPDRLGRSTNGSRSGWWGIDAASEAYLDQLVTWRELGFHFCLHTPGYDRFDTLPAWAQRTLAAHAGDRRPWRYDLPALDRAQTHDELWNAAQRQLVREGRMHNYLRMLWGKKVLEWSATPQQALATLIELNNRYAIDGRDPNSYSGILWCFGRFDRAWGPVRPIFGTVRYMSSANTARKLRVRSYVERYRAP